MSLPANAPAKLIQSPRPARPNHARHLFLILIITALVRIAWMAIAPAHAYSVDLKDWRYIAALSLGGINPYLQYTISWPPLWIEILSVIARISDQTKWDFFTCVRIVLITAELIVISGTYLLVRQQNKNTPILKLFLIGFAFNPLLILLTIQHANFDAIPMIGVIFFLFFLIQYRRAQNSLDWILAALCLGLAVAAKTFPFILSPLLIPGIRHLRFKSAVIGAALLTLPALISLAPLYLLGTTPVGHGPIGYRSTPGAFGITGLLALAGHPQSIPLFARSFTLILLLFMATVALRLWKKDIARDQNITLFAAMTLLGLFVLGPGYGTQYWFWVIPLLIASYPTLSPRYRKIVLLCAFIIIATCVFEYAFTTDKGRFLYFFSPSDQMRRINIFFESPRNIILLRLPMFAASLLLLLTGCLHLRTNCSTDAIQ